MCAGIWWQFQFESVLIPITCFLISLAIYKYNIQNIQLTTTALIFLLGAVLFKQQKINHFSFESLYQDRVLDIIGTVCEIKEHDHKRYKTIISINTESLKISGQREWLHTQSKINFYIACTNINELKINDEILIYSAKISRNKNDDF